MNTSSLSKSALTKEAALPFPSHVDQRVHDHCSLLPLQFSLRLARSLRHVLLRFVTPDVYGMRSMSTRLFVYGVYVVFTVADFTSGKHV